MARLPSKRELLEIVVSAITECGWNATYIDADHPFRLHVYDAMHEMRARIYIWNVTHGGGRARPAHEYRIQITGLTQNRFDPEPGGKTLILGWWSEAGVFAGFDFRRHQGALGSSPSLQIREECLRQAYVDGFAPCLKENQEIAIAFRPDCIAEYMSNLELLHRFGESLGELALLQSVASDPRAVNDTEIATLPKEREAVVRSVQQRLRASDFRARVLTSYGHTCAFCGLQLNLVTAAHIVPVRHEGSTDATYNGVAACFLHHAAYDRGLVTFGEDYRILVNEREMRRFRELKRDGGMGDFRAALRPLIKLPPALSDRPHVDFIRRANRIRGWSS